MTDETQGRGWELLLHPEDFPKSNEKWREALRTGETFETEYRFKRASDGVYRWHLARAVPVYDGEGEILKWIGTCTDIEEKKREAEAYAARAAIVEAADDAEKRASSGDAFAGDCAGRVLKRSRISTRRRQRMYHPALKLKQQPAKAAKA